MARTVCSAFRQNGPIDEENQQQQQPPDTHGAASDETSPLLGRRAVAATNAEPVPNVAPAKPARLLYLDHIRGLLMIFQSIDHSRGMLSRINIPHEEWWNMPDYKGNLYHWFVRFLTALCAPGFMMTMGCGILLFTMSRRKLGWKWSSIIRHFFIRGLVLVIVNFAMTAGYGILLTVLFALGVDMFLGACILALETAATERLAAKLESRNPDADSAASDPHKKAAFVSISFYALFAAVITSLSSIYTPTPEHTADNYNIVWRTLFLPFPKNDKSAVYDLYPPVPWLGMVLWGIMLQRLITVLKLRSRDTAILHLALGTILWIIFIPVRLINGFGNINPGQLHPSPRHSFINFFNLTKYPPSIAYTTCTIGIVHLLCAFFITAEIKLKNTAWSSPKNPLNVYGTSAFFFYLSHFYVYQGMAVLLRLVGALPENKNGLGFGGDQSGNLPDPWYWLTWVVGLAILYPMCFFYGRFKQSRSPNSLWRLF
ncbi:hypothetical protein DFS34DRAFT_632513 [Phlyctochytrium arcticum]|nr:hypothetical protein DFS34DRAFT_632513 [Phlyctochytrium arcticum]